MIKIVDKINTIEKYFTHKYHSTKHLAFGVYSLITDWRYNYFSIINETILEPTLNNLNN